MHKSDFLSLIRLLLAPVILMLLGIILLASPDSATTLLVQILGWVLIAAAVGLAVWAVAFRGSIVAKVLGALIFGLAGVWMVTHPLALAAWFGRLVGILLLIQGIQDILYIRLQGNSPFLPILTAVAGAVLVALPMTTSRLVFRIIGGVVLAIGIFMLAERLRSRRHRPGPPRNPDIIDAL